MHAAEEKAITESNVTDISTLRFDDQKEFTLLFMKPNNILIFNDNLFRYGALDRPRIKDRRFTAGLGILRYLSLPKRVLGNLQVRAAA